MNRIGKEKETVSQMIALYCHAKHKAQGLCEQCHALEDYAHTRLSRCKFGENKTSCKKCPIHCYKPDMREAMRNVMRYSGPRMLWHHPLAAIRHLFSK
ncbi:MAG: nitrous oxide-stimulated promoter family protein [Paludibacteraceae bacterium]|nr:nitrous oxide-stimulated promoter family protein [Paludibacteraceae bacterium]